MGQLSQNVASVFHILYPRAGDEGDEPTGTAPEQGGLLSGKDPTAVDFHDPIRIWIIQIGVIISMATLLSLGLKRIRQPKVIAEVLGGIILGPTAFGQIPGFQEHIFPEPTIPFLSLTATIGLCLFLFLVGLEIDAGIIKRNARLSATVALGGMVLPFGLGVALAVPIYNEFIDESIKFTNFMLFVGVAFSITAFPVLCRILTELKLLDTTVGIVVLSAGVGNDIIGWVLLALSVALVNAGSGLMALYILLVCVGFTLLLLFPGRWLMQWVAVKTGSIENGPTMMFMTITILLLFGSAFFTDIIGVHAIFGAFVAGIIVPREGQLNITLTEKLEDMVSIIFLPLYFTLSGLSTDLTLLNNGITWGFTIAICVLAFVGKFGGCFVAAKLVAGFNIRESSTIGALMSCKGLVELIVLNVGLQAGILSQRVFSMFVLEALILTFITTPLTTVLYPPHLRLRVGAGAAHQARPSDDEASTGDKKGPTVSKKRFTVVLDKLEHVPGMMALTQLIQPPSNDSESTLVAESSDTEGKKVPSFPQEQISIEALRLITLSDRTSAVMRSSAAETLLVSDPVLGIFRMFGQLNDMPMTPSLAIVPYDDLSYSVVEHARNHGTEMIMVPWLPPHPSVPEEYHGGLPVTPNTARSNINPFDLLFKSQAGSTANAHETSASAIHSHFIRGVFSLAQVDVALYVDRTGAISVGSGVEMSGSYHHLFLPFFGGPDDRLALEFVGQCCQNPRVTATVVKIVKREDEGGSALVAEKEKHEKHEEMNGLTVASVAPGMMPDTVYGAATTETRLQSETADNIVWAKYTSPSPNDPNAISSSVLSRMSIRELTTPTPLHTAILEAADSPRDDLPRPKGHVRKIVVVGRSKRMAVENHAKELKGLIQEKEKARVAGEVKRTIGDVGTAFVVAGMENGIVVVQAAAGMEN